MKYNREQFAGMAPNAHEQTMHLYDDAVAAANRIEDLENKVYDLERLCSQMREIIDNARNRGKF